MIPRTTRIFRCPGCGVEQDVPVWETINVALNPDLKPGLLSGELFDFKCGRCGQEAPLRYPLLYHDMKNRAMFWLVPKGPPPDLAEAVGFPGPRLPQSGYALRLVRDFNELIEKILLVDARIDDRLMELFKLHVQRQGHLAVYPKGTKLYFHGIDQDVQGQAQINLLILADEAETHLVVCQHEYRTWEERTKSLLPPIDPNRHEWLRIDRKYARCISGRR